MKLSDPVNIMLNCCIPDKKKLMEELSRLAPGDTVRIKIDNCVASRAMVENFLRNKWYSIVHTEDRDDSLVLSIRLDVDA